MFSLQQTESDLQAGYVEQCADYDGLYPFRCTVAGSSNSYYVSSEAYPGTKCIAEDGSRNPNNVSIRVRIVTNMLFRAIRVRFVATLNLKMKRSSKVHLVLVSLDVAQIESVLFSKRLTSHTYYM